MAKDEFGNKIKKSKKSKKGKKKDQKKMAPEDGSSNIHECGPGESSMTGSVGGGSQAPPVADQFDGNYADFLKLKAELPEIPAGGEAAEYTYGTPHGVLKVKVNPNTATGLGRKNTQLDGKQITAPVLKELLNQQTSPANAASSVGIGSGADLLDGVYNKKDLKKQMELMDLSDPKSRKKILKPLDKQISGVQAQATLMQDFGCSPSTVKDILEALCR